MKLIRIIAVLALLLIAAASALGQMSDYQRGIAEGLKYGFFMNQKYVDAKAGINISGYNAEVAKYNAWIKSIFGNDPMYLMSPMTSVATPRPILIANNTTSKGMVHSIDGNIVNGPTYTTNDMNLLPKSAIDYINNQKDSFGAEYLGGI